MRRSVKNMVLKYYLFVFTGGMGRGRSLFALDSDDDRARELEFARDLGVMAPLKKKYLFCPILHKKVLF